MGGMKGEGAKSILQGAIGFAIVSLAGFAVWALGGKWLYSHGGEVGLYLACSVVFIGLAGICLHPLVRGERRLSRFYKGFVPAFLGYAIAWSLCWFALRFGAGEWLGSLAGCLVFAGVLKFALRGASTAFLASVLVLFLTHSLGYFTGGFLYAHAPHWGPLVSTMSKSQVALTAKLLWGVAYGLGFGAGIGFTYHTLQGDTAGPAAQRN